MNNSRVQHEKTVEIISKNIQLKISNKLSNRAIGHAQEQNFKDDLITKTAYHNN